MHSRAKKKPKSLDCIVQEGQLGSRKPALACHGTKLVSSVVCVLQGHSLQLQNKPCHCVLLALLCASNAPPLRHPAAEPAAGMNSL